MSEHGELLPESGMEWEREVRGYNRQQVDNYVAWRAGQVRELESRLSQSIGEIEHLRLEVAEARDAGGRPAHEEISDRFGRILKQAADAANAEQEKAIAEINQMRESAKADTDQLRVNVKQDTDRLRAEAQDRAERLLAAAQEQADRAVATAKAQAEDLMSSSQTAAEQMVADANKHAESTIAAAVAQAKQHLDEATARATAIHDGAERRLNLLISRHTETVRRLTEIRDVVTSLVTGEANRGSLEDEVARALSSQPGANGSDGRTSGQHDPTRSPTTATMAAGIRVSPSTPPSALTACSTMPRPAAQAAGASRASRPVLAVDASRPALVARC